MEADIGTLNIAGGNSVVAEPPGTLAQSAPRRAARGRSHDLLFLSLGVDSSTAHRVDQLAQIATKAFFGTPGSVTSALRQAAVAVNQAVLDEALAVPFIAGALRNRDLYVAQCGPGQLALVRSGTVQRSIPVEGTSRSLGSSLAPLIHFAHLEVKAGDLILASTADPSAWSDTSLAGLSDLALSPALDRLASDTSQDLTGVLLRVPGASTAQPAPAKRTVPRTTEQLPHRAAEPRTDLGASDADDQLRRRASDWVSRGRSVLSGAWRAFLEVMLRLAPGLVEAPRMGEFSPNILAFTAAAVPVLVVGISSIIYFSKGRAEQFESYLAQAHSAAASAQLSSDSEAARPDWVLASQWLDLAESYRQTDQSTDLRRQVNEALDALDLVVRLEFAPAISGGFGPQAEIVAVAATASDLYAYDSGTETIWHAWSTGRGYEIDSQFECLTGEESIPGFGLPVSIVVQPEPGALGTEGVVALDADGTLLYCAPGTQPLTGQLAPPDVGWGLLQAIDVFGDRLYVLDPEKNAVWIYDAADGLFSGSPALYFVEEVPELGTAIDLALAQDELIILYGDGAIDRCRRNVENTAEGTIRIRVECESDPSFLDERPGQLPHSTIPGAEPAGLVYSAPPEPSLFFLDASEGTVFHYSMRLVYQGQYPTAFDSPVSAVAEGPPNDLFVAAGDQVYYAQLGR
jgi:hypothetical protein